MTAVHPHLDGVLLDVAYRGSSEPQLLDVGVKLSGPAEIPLAPWAIGSLVACIARGFAGGAEFAPTAGHAKLEAGPTGEGPTPTDGELGPEYAFRLSVAGMSPRFVRVLAEHLAASGRPHHRLQTLSIVGALPTDGSELSVREDRLAAWLDDPGAYPRAWDELPFRVTTRSIPRGATVHVALASGRIDDVADALEETLSTWQTAVLTVPNARHTARGVMAPHFTFARTATELYAKVPLFDHARVPARAALLNGLARFHARVRPLASVAIAMP